jgi:hypothetical protein
MPAHGDFFGAGGSQYVPHVIMRWVYNLGFQWSDSIYDYLRWSGWILFLFNILIADWFRRRGDVQTIQLTLAPILLSLSSTFHRRVSPQTVPKNKAVTMR